MSDDHLIDLVDNDWKNDVLPNEDIQLPLDKLPDPEENENQTSLKEVSNALLLLYQHSHFVCICHFQQEDRWLDLAIMSRHTDEQLNISNP